jgi:hypothetical protein
VVRRLAQHCVVIEPTTIDEFRFKGATLDMRWPFRQTATSEMLYETPVSRNPLMETLMLPGCWDDDTRNVAETSHIFKRYADAVFRQIGARDHYLVEQAAIVACYRPLFCGNASRGVDEELKHHGRLMEHAGQKSPAVVFCPPEDRYDYHTEKLCDAIQTWVKKKTITTSPEDHLRLLSDIRTKQVPERDVLLQGNRDALFAILDRYNCRVEPKTDGEYTDAALGPDEFVLREAQVGELLQDTMAAAAPSIDRYSKSKIIKLLDTPEEFYQELGV